MIAQPFRFANSGMISNSGASKPLAKQPQHLNLSVNKVEKQVIRPLTARELEKQSKTKSKALIIEAMEGKEDGGYAMYNLFPETT